VALCNARKTQVKNRKQQAAEVIATSNDPRTHSFPALL